MNERLAAGLLAGLSIALIAAESATAALVGFDPGVILFWFALYVGGAGLLFSLKGLSGDGKGRIESVSERRARAKHGDGGILEGYDVDEEFLGRGIRTQKPSPAAGRRVDDGELREVIASSAGMAGGLAALRGTVSGMDDASFAAMVRKLGLSGVSRERALAAVEELLAAEAGGQAGQPVPPLRISMDKETFDDYIRRCMTDGETCIDDDGKAGDCFSIGLDADGLSRMPGTPPATFSHSPEAVKANRPGDLGS